MRVRGARREQIYNVPIEDAVPSPENDLLYRPILDDDPEVVRLARSIEKHGVLEALVLSRDGYIISGHRRRAAAELAGLSELPVRYEDVVRGEDSDRFVVLLREHNRQRSKDFAEQVRETTVDADAETAMNDLIRHRRLRSKTGHDPIRIPEGRGRSEISEAKREFVEATKRVIAELEDYWPLSVRQIHYGLLNAPPRRHASKPQSGYVNDVASYKSLVELLTRMRLVGVGHWAHVAMHAIDDETRPESIWNVHRDVPSYLARELEDFLTTYARDLQASQPNHVEVIVEKNTAARLVSPVCAEFSIAMTSGRGYSSIPPRAKIAQRYEDSGKEKLIVVLVSDFDPEGENIGEAFARSMRDDFGVERIEAVKAALTATQVKSFKLPPLFEAKVTSSRASRFVEEHGNNVWELEALAPQKLQEIVRDCLLGVLDVDMLNRERLAEAEDARKLRELREAARAAIRKAVS